MTKSRVFNHRTIWLGMSLCVLCVGYFYVLDRSFLSSVGFSPIFRFLLREDKATAWIALAISIFSMLWNRSAPIVRIVDFVGQHPCVVALACVALLAVGTITIYQDYPLSMDEYAAVFQSKIFASGHLSARLPPSYIDWMVVRGFDGEFLATSHETGNVVEKFWPGFALLLAPFEFFHMRWLCNAFLAGISLLLIHWITQLVTQDKHAAGWAVLFAVASGAFVAEAISFYSMQAHLTLNLLFAALLLRPTRYRAFGAGLAGSLALTLHNPVPHALFALPWLAALMMDRKEWRHLLPLVLGYFPAVALGLSWVAFRTEIATPAQYLPGFGRVVVGVFTWPNEPVFEMRAASFVKFCVWAVPGLLALAVLGFVRRRDDTRVRLLALSATLTFAGYFFVTFDQGHGWGNRYLHSAWGVIPILAACAMPCKSESNRRLICFAGAAAILNLLVIVPFQLNQIEKFISQHLAQLSPPQRPGNNVYFVHPRQGFYLADLVQIDPFLRDPDLVLVSRGSETDLRMILLNWPDAVKLSSGQSYDHWYLGSGEHRRAMRGEATKRFVLRDSSE
jgi:hypothetical protein